MRSRRVGSKNDFAENHLRMRQPAHRWLLAPRRAAVATRRHSALLLSRARRVGVRLTFAAHLALIMLAGYGAASQLDGHHLGMSAALNLSVDRTMNPTLASARPGAGPVTCRGEVCQQLHDVQNPSGSACSQNGVWVSTTAAPERTYRCVTRHVAESTY